MSRIHRVAVTKEEWDDAAAAYELGSKHGAQIARELGVSPATVSREFQRRGCRKGCRVDEYVAEFLARLDAEAEEKVRAEAAKAAERKAAIARFVDQIFGAIDAAHDAGESLGANPEIARIDKELQLALR
jgi:DNA-binding MurR/RpiR family transcriptional regulator